MLPSYSYVLRFMFSTLTLLKRLRTKNILLNISFLSFPNLDCPSHKQIRASELHLRRKYSRKFLQRKCHGFDIAKQSTSTFKKYIIKRNRRTNCIAGSDEKLEQTPKIRKQPKKKKTAKEKKIMWKLQCHKERENAHTKCFQKNQRKVVWRVALIPDRQRRIMKMYPPNPLELLKFRHFI